jgi:hypothetical protein
MKIAFGDGAHLSGTLSGVPGVDVIKLIRANLLTLKTLGVTARYTLLCFEMNILPLSFALAQQESEGN